MTEKDRRDEALFQSGKVTVHYPRTRHGLTNHLRHNWSLNHYCPSFHVHARLFARKHASFDEFEESMKKTCTAVELEKTCKTKHLEDAWNFWKNVKK